MEARPSARVLRRSSADPPRQVYLLVGTYLWGFRAVEVHMCITTGIWCSSFVRQGCSRSAAASSFSFSGVSTAAATPVLGTSAATLAIFLGFVGIFR